MPRVTQLLSGINLGCGQSLFTPHLLCSGHHLVCWNSMGTVLLERSGTMFTHRGCLLVPPAWEWSLRKQLRASRDGLTSSRDRTPSQPAHPATSTPSLSPHHAAGATEHTAPGAWVLQSRAKLPPAWLRCQCHRAMLGANPKPPDQGNVSLVLQFSFQRIAEAHWASQRRLTAGLPPFPQPPPLQGCLCSLVTALAP